jgi:hypothetical protein
MSGLIPMKRITIERAEGYTDDPYWKAGETRTFTDWEIARAALIKLCCSLDPSRPGYDKCDFTVEFEDGNLYTGRFDAAHPDSSSYEQADLQKHIRDYVQFMAGLSRPSHMSADDYKRFMLSNDRRGDAVEFLKLYEVGQ